MSRVTAGLLVGFVIGYFLISALASIASHSIPAIALPVGLVVLLLISLFMRRSRRG
jgi:hypothetical protein